jgi:hypothetical protein
MTTQGAKVSFLHSHLHPATIMDPLPQERFPLDASSSAPIIAQQTAATTTEHQGLQMKEEAWRKCATPCAQAMEDPARFLQHYFHTNGSPDRAKTPKPLVLDDFRRRDELEQHTKKVAGLHVCSAGQKFDFVVCIGWGLSAVYEAAEQITHDFAIKRAESRKARTESDLKKHHDIADKIKRSIDPATLTKEDKLWEVYGTYVVHCDDLVSAEEDWEFDLAIEHHTSPGLLQAEV